MPVAVRPIVEAVYQQVEGPERAPSVEPLAKIVLTGAWTDQRAVEFGLIRA